jgi:hypothetical protein
MTAMASEANRFLTGGGIELDVTVEDGTVFFTYCDTCKKVLYCATVDNTITRQVARFIMEDHFDAYGQGHETLIIKR